MPSTSVGGADSTHRTGTMIASQGGLRAGSPPSPPPRLIRPTVRRLLRSPRFWVRVPVRTGCCPDQTAVACCSTILMNSKAMSR